VLLTFLGLPATARAQKLVWIDTDPSVAPGGREVDDGIALLQAFASPELDIRGVSIVFGNTDLATAARIGKEIVGRFGPKSLSVFAGASGPADLGRETDASRALEQELRRRRLTILVLGPATNVATVVRNHPELGARIDEIVAVAGRRPGQRFVAGNSQKTPFRDLNFELDPEAFRILLAAKVPMTLAPWEISSRVWLTRSDVQTAADTNPGMAWLRHAAEDWLVLWRREFGADGFNPFDALAVGYLVDRGDLECRPLAASIEEGPDDISSAQPAPGKPFFLVRPALAGKPAVNYCYTAKDGFHQDLVRRLSRGARR
jgi:pyrimidine-specific ribonucleoside hydrolase